jgi:uncharacterized protein (DUF1697 family)
MTRYVAFLRGINVGKRIAKMGEVEAVFEELGFDDVATFRQSGNVVFETNTEPAKVVAKIEAKLRDRLGYDVPVFLRTFGFLQRALEPFLVRQAKERTAGWSGSVNHSITFFIPSAKVTTCCLMKSSPIISRVGSLIHGSNRL